jgi:hypothetical protein
MRLPSKANWIAERYERMGSENPTVGIALSWKRGTLFRFGINKKGKDLTIESPRKYRLRK